MVENLPRYLPDELERLDEHFLVAAKELDVVRRAFAGVEADARANHKRHRLGFELAASLRCLFPTFTAVQQLVSDFMHERPKLLCRRQTFFAADAATF